MTFTPHSFGPYYLIDRLGKSTTAEVFLAISQRDQQLYALKRLLPAFVGRAEYIDRLTSEAKISSLLSHPNIVAVRDFGAIGTDVFLAFDFVDGQSLASLLGRLEEKKFHLSFNAAAYVLEKVGSALESAHQAKDPNGRPLGIVHCDVTPSNILIAYDGSVKLTDFGIAMQEQSLRNRIPFGKLPYMAPEHLEGGFVSQRSDVYSLAVLIYETLTLVRPFRAKDTALLRKEIVSSEPALIDPPLDQHPNLRSALLGALDKDPRGRPLSALSLLKDMPKGDSQLEGQTEIRDLLSILFRQERTEEEFRRQDGLRSYQDLVVSPSTIEESPPDDVYVEDVQPEVTEFRPIGNAVEVTRIKPKKISIGQLLLQKTAALPAISLGGIKRSTTVTRPIQKIRSIPKTPVAIMIGCLVLAFLGSTLRRSPAMTPLSELQIYPVVEGTLTQAEPDARMFWSTPSQRERAWIVPIQTFLRQEHQRWTESSDLPFKLKIEAPKEQMKPIDWQGTLFHSLLPFEELQRFLQIASKAPIQTGLLYVYLYPKVPEERSRYPLQFNGSFPERQRLLFLPLLEKEYGPSVVRLLQEVLRLLGAKEKTDGEGLPLHPSGFVEPEQIPLYPQRNGEAMTKGIPLSATEYKPFTSLKEAKIGKATARELGWLPSVR